MHVSKEKNHTSGWNLRYTLLVPLDESDDTCNNVHIFYYKGSLRKMSVETINSNIHFGGYLSE